MNTRNATTFTQSELVFRTTFISGSNVLSAYPTSNTVGSINKGRTECTWNTINLMNILGDQYHKFEYFNLILRTVQYTGIVSAPAVNERLLNIVVSGPSWVNSSYDVGSRHHTLDAVMGQVIISSTLGSLFQFDDNCMATFKKTPTFNFTIKLQTLAGVPPVFDPLFTLFPGASYYFDIVPVQFPDPEKNPVVY